MPIFRQSIFRTQCDACGTTFSISKGGVCTQCKRILCNAHLFGSFTMRLRTTLLGRPAVCVRCRAQGAG